LGGKKGPGVRFAAGRREGPRSNVWRLFTTKGKDDVYLSCWSFADVVKVSLHESGDWRYALISPDKNRVVDRWLPPNEFAPGFVKALQVIVPSSEVVMPSPHEEAQDRVEKKIDWEPPDPELLLISEAKQDRYAKEILWFPRAPHGFVTCFTVVLSAPDAPEPSDWYAYAGQDTYPVRSIWHAELPNRTVRLVVYEKPMSERNREGMEKLRQQCHQTGKSAMGEPAYGVLKDRRAFFFNSDAHGTRTFVDIALTN
jgi:hypothetical protein